MSQTKALVLLSGGLDSMLAVKVLQAQNIEVEGLCFESNFFSCEKARASADKLAITLREESIGVKLLELVKNPPNGYGKHLNPCVDCHALMFKEAGKYLKKNGGEFDILASGEVLGQRPFSQNKEALIKIQELAGVDILRPLSAKWLFETSYEKSGLVNRGKLLRIKDRNRQDQFELAEKFNLKDYAMPAGGCVLTDPDFTKRLLNLLDYLPDCDTADVELLKNGRIFWLKHNHKKIMLVVAREEKEDGRLKELARLGDVILELKDEVGPVTLIRKPFDSSLRDFTQGGQTTELEVKVPEEIKLGELRMDEDKSDEEIIKIAVLLTGWYATKARGRKVKIIINIIS